MSNYNYQHLKDFARNVFIKIGFSPENASQASEVLISADLRGIDSHGIARLENYVRLWEKGRANSTPNLRIVHETPSTAVVDGDSGLGLVSGPFAMQKAIEKAKTAGTGWVAVNNSNHFGIAGFHAMMAMQEDMIGIAMTNASPLVAPTFSNQRLLGTNPIAFAVPTGTETPFIMDMATTTVANGKLEILQRKEEDAPSGWIQDKNGLPTTDPWGVKNGGALTPLGGDREHGSHKGYCLGSMVDILSAVLPGANYGPWVPPFVAFLDPPENPVGKGIGHFFGALRIDAFRPAQEFKEHMDNWIRTFRESSTVPGNQKVEIPGDQERRFEQIRKNEGIPLLTSVVESMDRLAKKLNLNIPLPLNPKTH
jgi:LDH2 family malate/lactate/ureidoglycolate dehydrogenase